MNKTINEYASALESRSERAIDGVGYVISAIKTTLLSLNLDEKDVVILKEMIDSFNEDL